MKFTLSSGMCFWLGLLCLVVGFSLYFYDPTDVGAKFIALISLIVVMTSSVCSLREDDE